MDTQVRTPTEEFLADDRRVSRSLKAPRLGASAVAKHHKKGDNYSFFLHSSHSLFHDDLASFMGDEKQMALQS